MTIEASGKGPYYVSARYPGGVVEVSRHATWSDANYLLTTHHLQGGDRVTLSTRPPRGASPKASPKGSPRAASPATPPRATPPRRG